MGSYKVLNNQIFSIDAFSIHPIRYEDRMAILKWRNEQVYHLRQDKPLTVSDQENYFKNVINKLFTEEKPDKLLFSYMHDGLCIGYGGLVHINWTDKNAEISFIMNTELEEKYFSKHWNFFLKLIEEVAFKEIELHKIFTFAFDLRPHLYEVIEQANWTKEAVLKSHFCLNGEFKDIVIHSKFNTNK